MIRNKLLQFWERFYFLIIPIGVTMISFLFFHPYYDIGKDDLVLSNMVNSAQTNEHSEFLVFISIYLGYLMRAFALWFPTLNIYEITLVFFYTMGFVAIFYNTRKYQNKLLAVVILVTLQIFLLFGITFTIVAFLCSAAGVLLILENVKRMEKRAIPFFILGFLLIFAGLGYRRGDLAICVFLLFLPTIYFSFRKSRNTLPVLLAVVVIFTGTHEFLKASQTFYNRQVLGEEYIEFNHYRGVASDGGTLDYEEHQEYYEEHGITETDVKMYTGFRFNDKTMFPVEKVKALAESLNTENKYLFNIGELAEEVFEDRFFQYFLLIGIAAIIFLKKNRWEILGTVVFVFGAVVYLHFRRRGIGRVVNPIVFIGFVVLLYRFLEHGIQISKKRVEQALRYGVIAILLIYGIVLPMQSHRNGYYWFEDRTQAKSSKIVNHIREDMSHKYVSFSSFSSMRNIYFTRQEPIADNLISNVYVGWMVYTPYWYDLLEQHGIDQYKDCLYRSLIDPRIKILCNSSSTMECLEQSLEETYGIHVQRRLGMVRDKRQIYQMWELEEDS